MFVQGIVNQTKTYIGSGSERIKVPPRTYMVVEFPRPVKATPSPIHTTLSSGELAALAGIFSLKNNGKKHFFVRFDCDDMDATTVNVESNRSLSPVR
jgi:hypothetical protein